MDIGRKSAQPRDEDVRFSQAGSGPPLVLIHGLLGGAFCWRRNVPVWAQEHTTFAVELPGFGESPAHRNLTCGMEAQARRLLRWLEERDLDSVDVVASSWGGGVAFLLAAMTRRVRSLVLAAPVNPWSELGRERVRFFRGRIRGTLLRLGMPISRPIHRVILERMYGDPARIPAGTLEGYSRLMLCPGRASNLINTLANWEPDLHALREAIERVHAPALLLWGSRDGAVDLYSAEELMKRLPACELRVIEGAGHLPFEETPDEFNRLASVFWQQISAKTLVT